MTDEQLIIAVAKLDGWVREESEHPTFKSRIVWWIKSIGTFERRIAQIELPPYLTSRDAIIPVICKQHVEVQRDVYRQLFAERFESSTDKLSIRFTVSLEEIFHKTARDLSIALVKATGNWTEE